MGPAAMQVTGEEGITIEDCVVHQKSVFLDMVYLQQDAFDEIDASISQERQKQTFELVRRLIQRDYPFKNKDEARKFFTQLTGSLKNLNYAPQGSPDHAKYLAQIDDLVKTLGRTPAAAPAAA